MRRKSRVLVTGHLGYIGSVLTAELVKSGYDVFGLDTGYFHECSVRVDTVNVPWIRKDIRDVDRNDVRGFDSVIHLAALSNDPIGNLNDTWTEEINHRASVQLAELSREAGVRRFLFSSSCIMYGTSSARVVTEEAPLDPKTQYARSKVKAEAGIAALASEGFSPAFLRNGTVYGLSPRMRFDTVLNDLVGRAVTTGKVKIYSDGKPWRPVVHVEDVARAFQRVLEAPIETVHNQAFNTGAEKLNHRIIELAEVVVKTVPDCDLEVMSEQGADLRTYKADFTKFGRAFPDFEFKFDPACGVKQLATSLKQIQLGEEEFSGKRFIRLRWLDYLLRTGRLDGDLRWRSLSGK